jgi:hypothetical protein
MSDTAVADAPAKTQVGLADVLHRLVQRADFNQAEEQAHHSAIRDAFAAHLDSLSDAEKEGRMASVLLASPGQPSIVPGFTVQQFNSAVAQQVEKSVGDAVSKALEAERANRNADIQAAVAAALAAASKQGQD